jgi:hypothetical protein
MTNGGIERRPWVTLESRQRIERRRQVTLESCQIVRRAAPPPQDDADGNPA